MYQDVIRIYLVGFSDEDVSRIKGIANLPSFEHAVLASNSLDVGIAKDSDLILLNACCGVQDAPLSPTMDAESVRGLLKQANAEAKSGADIVFLASHEVFEDLKSQTALFSDFWPAPMSGDELEFRMQKWLLAHKQKTDLWQANQFLDATIDSIPSLVWYKTRDGIHEKVNDSFCATVNKTKEQVQGQRHAYIWDVETDDPACIESENEVMASGKTCVSEEVVQTGSGTRLLTTYKSPLYNTDGSVMGTVGVGIDVTQERAYEHDLVEKNKTLETIFRTLDCGVLIHSLDGKEILGANEKALEILGYDTQQDMLDDGFLLIARSVMEEDQERLKDQINQLENVGDSFSTQYRVRHPDGEILHVMGDIKLIEKDGERYIQRFLLDITAQKAREAQKDWRQRNLIQALSGDYIVVCAFDLDSGEGEVLRMTMNPDYQLESIFEGDIAFDEVIEKYISSRVLDEDREMLERELSKDHIKTELKDKNRFDLLYRAQSGDTSSYRQLSIARVGTNEDNSIVVGFRNVDQQIRQELEHKTLLEEALVYANKANKAKSDFLLNMSHDIRTPMNAIVGFTELATRHADDPDRINEYLEKIKASGDHLLNLINDILDMSRIEQGKVSLEEEPCNLIDIFSNLQSILNAQAAQNGLTLNVDVGSIAHPEVICDRLKVNQILMNLAGNSLKFTPEGGVVSLRLEEVAQSDSSHGRYRLSVVDNGIGMSPEFLKQIYDPFERERTQTISGIQGSGLGMAIVKNLVDMMGGSIDVESKLGCGTRFSVMLTLEFANSDSEAQPKKDGTGSSFDPSKASNYRLLLVDDNALNREIAKELLEEFGFIIETANDGQDALNRVKSSHPGEFDLILMDIQMPLMNGYEAARAIRALSDKDLSAIPILALTADAFEEDRRRALDCGMNGHIAKPIEVDRLFSELDSILC